MRCEEIQDRFVDLLYREPGTPPASPELRAHIESCPACRQILEELRNVQTALHLWEDEPIPQAVDLPRREYSFHRRGISLWGAVRYAAVAAVLLIAFLALASPEITWNKQGFSFKTNTPWGMSKSDYYTKEETRSILKRVMDDSEKNMTEANYLMMQELLDTVEKDRMMDLRFVRHQPEANRNKN